MLTIHCRSCAKRDERQLEIAVSPKLGTMFAAPGSRMKLSWGLSEEAVWEYLWRWQRETQERSCPTGRGGTFIIWTWPMQADRLLAITTSSGSCLCVPRLHHSLCQSRLARLNTCEEKMAGLEGSSVWAVSFGPFISSSAWGNCREGYPEGAALGLWPGGKQPLDLTPSFSTLSQQALLCQVPFGLQKWGRENVL